jgi:hypothetical protein
VEIVVRPCASGRGRFQAVFAGEVLCASRTPLLTAARVLRRRGISDDTPLVMRHEGSAVIAMRTTVGVAVGLTAEDRNRGTARFTRLRLWDSVSAPDGSPDSGV